MKKNFVNLIRNLPTRYVEFFLPREMFKKTAIEII